MDDFLDKDERMWAMFCHLSVFLGYVVPFGNIIAPLVIWLVKKEECPFVGYHGREALNFQISMTILIVLGVIGCFFCIGVPFLIVLGVINVVFPIIAAIKANDGIHYRYPMTLRFL